MNASSKPSRLLPRLQYRSTAPASTSTPRITSRTFGESGAGSVNGRWACAVGADRVPTVRDTGPASRSVPERLLNYSTELTVSRRATVEVVS